MGMYGDLQAVHHNYNCICPPDLKQQKWKSGMEMEGK